GRERLAVHARQLAVEPRLQILRRHPRSLLLRLEPPHRSAMAHHVTRTTVMGSSVLIRESWYNTVALCCPALTEWAERFPPKPIRPGQSWRATSSLTTDLRPLNMPHTTQAT